MNFKRIMLPTDFSHAGNAALSLATSLARDCGATLLIVHVEEPPMAYGGGELYYGAFEPTHSELRRMLDEIHPLDPDVPCERLLVSGEPSSTLVELAKDNDVDLIVMGTHGRTGLFRLLMGSVAEAVVRRAPCPVLTYRVPAKNLAKV